ncbi:hypothetical protein GCM10010307_03640 [Streptomyces vastus]|uniref:Uncharacterized protein n=1 Tax=Streptomyces vastus TaxID=285451 RepID=A0ABP6CHR6_9ACTN
MPAEAGSGIRTDTSVSVTSVTGDVDSTALSVRPGVPSADGVKVSAATASAPAATARVQGLLRCAAPLLMAAP